NLKVTDQLIPAYGVYETRVEVDGETVPAVTNVGYRPTVNGEALTIESNLLGFDRMIYGKTITLTFVRYLREEKKFDSPEALFEQVRKDVETVLKEM
ncbi:MAG: riboflavin kinase, partial [Clostridia bacterium]|nr:riboflavin kinase [Clostridia bacterium]